MKKEESNEKRKINFANNRFPIGDVVHSARGKRSTVERGENGQENPGCSGN
jgi:hypothetical protein